MSLSNYIAREIDTDDDDQSERVVNDYNNATEQQKKAVDDIFIGLTGWSLETLIADWVADGCE
jgi:hypothetical protein